MVDIAPNRLVRTLDGHNPSDKSTGARQYNDLGIDQPDWQGNEEFNLPDIAVQVIAPTSGKLMVSVGAGARDNGTAPNVDGFRLSFQVKQGGFAGSVLTDASTFRGWVSSRNVTLYMFGSRIIIIESLTPGNLYYIRAVWQSSQGTDPDTLDWQYPSLVVVPLP